MLSQVFDVTVIGLLIQTCLHCWFTKNGQFFLDCVARAQIFSSWVCVTIQFNYPRHHTLIQSSRKSAKIISEIFREALKF